MTTDNFPTSIPIKGRVRICLELLKKQPLKNKVFVDVGSSFGWLEKEMVNQGLKKIIGVEPHPKALVFAQKQIKGATFKAGNAANIPVDSDSADIVALYDVIEHVPQNTEKQVFKELNRITKKGGTLLLSTPYKHPIAMFLDLAWYFGHRHYSKQQITDFLNQGGFEVEQIETRGSFFSSFFLFWFYIMKRIFGQTHPRSDWLEKLDDQGYDTGKITDIFLVATKVRNIS